MSQENEGASMTDAHYAAECSPALSGVAEEWTEKDKNMYQVPGG